MKQTKMPDIAEVASGQWGMISAAQAGAVGVDARTLARLANNGELERLIHGVYRLAGSPPGRHDDLRAAWIALDPRRTAAERIAAGPTEVVSHRSAAVVHELGDLDADVLEFTASIRRQTRRSDVHIHGTKFADSDWTLADGLPITTPLRTIKDLAAARVDRGHLAGVVRDAVAQYGVSVGHIAEAIAPQARAYGVTAADGNRLVELLLREAGVPQAAMDMATHADFDAQRLLVGKLINSQAFDETMRNQVNALAASGVFEAASRLVHDLVIDDAVRASLNRRIAELASSLTPAIDAHTLRRLLAGFSPERKQVDAEPMPSEKSKPQPIQGPDDER